MPCAAVAQDTEKWTNMLPNNAAKHLHHIRHSRLAAFPPMDSVGPGVGKVGFLVGGGGYKENGY